MNGNLAATLPRSLPSHPRKLRTAREWMLLVVLNACASSGGEASATNVPPDCVASCQRAVAAQCPKGRSETDCENECSYVTTTAPSCRGENVAFVACTARATFKCNSLGGAAP